jgi:hypothetical protein
MKNLNPIHVIGCNRKEFVIGKTGRRARTEISKNGSRFLLTWIRRVTYPCQIRRRDLTVGGCFDYVTVNIVKPAVIQTANPSVLHTTIA